MKLICNQYVNEKVNSGRDAEENVLFVTSGTAHTKKQCNSLVPYVNIAPSSTCSQIWLTMRIIGRLLRPGIVLCSCTYEADYRQYVLTSICQEKQQEQATHQEALLFLNPHLESRLCAYHSRGLLEPLSNPTQRHCPGDWSFKGTTRSNIIYF